MCATDCVCWCTIGIAPLINLLWKGHLLVPTYCMPLFYFHKALHEMTHYLRDGCNMFSLLMHISPGSNLQHTQKLSAMHGLLPPPVHPSWAKYVWLLYSTCIRLMSEWATDSIAEAHKHCTGDIGDKTWKPKHCSHAPTGTRVTRYVISTHTSIINYLFHTYICTRDIYTSWHVA